MSVAVVTGGARGIGRAIAERLAAAGHRLVLVDVAEGLDATADELGAMGVRADITDPDGHEAIRAAVRELGGPLAVLVNNAGITRDRMIHKMDEEAFRTVVRVNLGGTYELTRALADLLAEGGAVVNLSSRAQLGNVGQFNYIVSKGGVLGLTRAMALELAPRVRVNAVAPGFTLTEMTDAMPEHVRQQIIDRIPLGQAGTPEDIANAVAFLASPESGYMTGQVLYVDGGRTFSSPFAPGRTED
jgi:3-oxoacyl-[acyl-carrier protein] reductase